MPLPPATFMNTIRAFIAAEIDHKTKQKISGLISNLKKSDADARWITESQIHLTLKFLGNIDEASVQKISDALSGVSNNFNSFTINFSGIGVFPNLNHPAVIWLGVNKGAEFLKTLNGKIETALEKLSLKQENREFKAHLTLARIRSPNNIQNLVKLIEEMDFNPWDDTRISKLVLFQSTLSPKGAAYTIITEKYLQNI